MEFTAQTIPQLFLEVCQRFENHSEKIAYATKKHNQWESVTHRELKAQVERLAAGLIELGVAAGDRIGIVSENRIEWVVTDFAVSAIGAIDVPVFYTLTSEQIAYIFRDCGVKGVVVSNQHQAEKLQEVRARIPTVEFIIVMNSNLPEMPGIISFDHALARGREALANHGMREVLDQRIASIKATDVLTLIYTSGTTGHPKGVMLSHRNILSNIQGAIDAFTISTDDSFLSYLPMCHSYERMSGYYLAFACGCTTYVAESIETVAENMREVHPTVMTSVPRLFERMRQRIEASTKNQSRAKQRIVSWAFALGMRIERGHCSTLDMMLRGVADRLVFAKVRQRMGNRLRFFISGGAALRIDDGLFFKAIGLTILEGYGLTETSPVLTVNREGDTALGTVGRPLPNVEIQIADDGEILARGPNVMVGYWNNEAATQAMIDQNGWLHTGDVGVFDAEGRLCITNRKKDIFVSSGGKNIAPQPVEAAILESRYVSQVVLIGDARDYCTALIVAEREASEEWARHHLLLFETWEQLCTSDEFYRTIQAELNGLQHSFSKFERARKFTVLTEPFTIENGMLTPTLKVKRRAVTEHYATIIDSMYGIATMHS